MTEQNKQEAPQISDLLKNDDENQEKEKKELESALAAGGGNTLAEDADKLDNLEEIKKENLKAWEERLGKKLGQQSETQTQTQSSR